MYRDSLSSTILEHVTIGRPIPNMLSPASDFLTSDRYSSSAKSREYFVVGGRTSNRAKALENSTLSLAGGVPTSDRYSTSAKIRRYFVAGGRTSNRAEALGDGSRGEVGSCKLAAELHAFSCAEISACSVVAKSRDCARKPRR